ncbi:MAG: PD-(D/E)XK nuclease domain-containing protein, partial [Deltaproteobacteria bacterium]|nr:PD-(D/E)XK nuclease domain-containing protein [Deltaproteobacteria bacterium]
SEVTESEGVIDFLITTRKDTVFVCEFKYEKLEPKETETIVALEARKQALLLKAINKAKEQIEFKRYADRYKSEYRVVKLVAVGIVGRTDVVLEIY